MRRRILAFAAGALLIAGPALAAEGGGKDKGKDKEPTQYVDLQPVGLPVVLNGRLINYIFVSIRIQLTPNANVSKVRTKEPYFRDALVKLGHRTPFTNPKSYMTLDMPRLKAVFGQEASAIAGPGNVQSIDVMAETPQKTSGLPHPDGGKTTTIQP
ncbi:hypothetical protein [Phenylobacterium aquaticum]|uniref:hypothetical protein n=1 Tax=Phenylobacterium aquaticum TaxID=1763816 RepID=UPI0026F1D359|nr:hypothetical protein [Phenylobacterium aquaticum]